MFLGWKYSKLNAIFLSNENIKSINLEIATTRKVYDDAVDELKALDNYNVWKQIKQLKESKKSFEAHFTEKSLQQDIFRLDDYKRSSSIFHRFWKWKC